MRKHARWIGLVLLGVAVGWVIHRPKEKAGGGPVPETLRVTPPDGSPRELAVLFSQDGRGFGPVRWRGVPGDRPTWQVGMGYPGGRRILLVAAETPGE